MLFILICCDINKMKVIGKQKNNCDHIDITALGIVLAYALSVFNYVIFLEFRLSDLILIICSFFFLYKNLKSRRFFPLFTGFIFLFFLFQLGNLVSLISGLGNNEIALYAFTYKYIFLFLVLAAGFYLGLSNERTFNFFLKLVFYVLIFQIIWAYYYTFVLRLSSIEYVATRVAFPSQSYEHTDAHLFSFCMSYLLITYLLVVKRRLSHSSTLSNTITLFALGALIFTGSRTGILLFTLFVVFFGVKSIIMGEVRLRSLFFLLIAMSVIAGFASQASLVNQDLINLFNRAFTFSQDDLSSMGRVRKTLIGISDYTEGFLFIGVGSFGSSLIWHDGILPTLLVHFGPIGLLLLSLCPFIILILLHNKGVNGETCANIFFLIFILYVALAITEYVLVSRGALLTLLPLSAYITKMMFCGENTYERIDNNC